MQAGRQAGRQTDRHTSAGNNMEAQEVQFMGYGCGIADKEIENNCVRRNYRVQKQGGRRAE